LAVKEIIRSLWRHKLALVALTAAAVAVAWHEASGAPPTYRSTSLVRIQQRVADPAAALGALESAGLLAETYAPIAKSTPVAEAVQHRLRDRVPLSDVAGNLSASVVDGLDLLRLQATASTPEEAQQLAAAMPAALASVVGAGPGSAEQLTVVEAADRPAHPFAPRPLRAALIALALGLLLNALLLVAWDSYADRAVTSVSQDRIGDQAVLALIPRLPLIAVGALGGRDPYKRSRWMRRRG
jgi:capsular polysaccharide biosynthesis protein